MNYKPVSYMLIGVVAGLLIASYFNRETKTKLTSVAPSSATAALPASGSAESDQRVAALTGELEDLRQKLAAASANAPVVVSPAESFAARLPAAQKEFLAAARQREVDKLIAAGFSIERIDWAKRRMEEIQVKQFKEIADAKAAGKSVDQNEVVANMIDPDLALGLEMGEFEYDRYRQALGKPDGVVISSVLATSNAEIAGLQSGDEILRYDGKRVYNVGMLDGLAAARTAKAAAVVEVRRNGQTIIVSIPRGHVGIRNSNIFTR